MSDGEKRVLAVELLINHVRPQPSSGGPDGHHRPLGIVLRCGLETARAWLTTRQVYDLSYDGVGGVVSSPRWTDGYRYRLFDGVTYVSDLVAAIESDDIALIPLEPHTHYQLVFDDHVLLLVREGNVSVRSRPVVVQSSGHWRRGDRSDGRLRRGRWPTPRPADGGHRNVSSPSRW
jgi:hypothetical protein